jgi:hypothetical protein
MKNFIFIPRVKIIILLALCLASVSSFSQLKKTRILFLLDASSSMTYSWNTDYKRFDIASNILLQIIDSVYAQNNEVEFAVRTYGSEHTAQEKNCTDTRLEVPFNFQNANQIKTRLKYIQALGSSPIAYSLKQASENELSEDFKYDYNVIFITDGGESCNGDVCKTYQEVLAKKIKIKPYVIGLDKNDNLKSYYDCLGQYIELTTTSDIPKAVAMIVEANKSIIDKPKSLNLVTTYTNTIIKKDTTPVIPVKKIETPVKILAQIGEIQAINYKIQEYIITIKLKKYIQFKKEKITIAFKTEEEPVVKKVETPVKIEEPKTERFTNVFPKLTRANYAVKNTEIKKTSLKTRIASKQKITVAFAIEEPVVRETTDLNYILGTNYMHPLGVIPRVKTLKAKALPKKPITVAFTVANEEPKIAIQSLKSVEYRQRYSYVYKMPNTNPLAIRKRSLTVAFKIDVPVEKIVTKPKPLPTIISTPTLDYTIETAPNAETMVQIYFIDKNTNTKKYTKAKPEIEIISATTKTSVLKFERKVENGEPIPQKIEAGTYNIIVKGQDDLTARNVKIEPNKINKIYIKVSEGKLQFSYMGNRERPVLYNAIVNRRFAKGATILQKCEDKLYYEPGNYYIEINTLPPIKYNTDIYFDAVTEYQLFEPGKAQIMNENNLGKVQLQVMLGDEFLTFFEIDIKGDLQLQQLELQPNTYQAVFYKNPAVPALGKKMIRFNIKSNQLTSVLFE